ncbi:putative integral membrane transport protein [Janibacter sp. HTCC2649]|uniref:ABC transporter permease n=1 Tax=Janibacter sp. HTCC2649 TaxID=313589 RepID=UPI000066EA11|nr:ABC transporter permease [Janibacter sp. HTCC2649]EAP99179.1 putative integral membrane transport protein [Janibacter sp. HTCC2649]
MSAATTGAAPARATQRWLAQARFETATILSHGEQLLVALVLPALALLGLGLADVPDLGAGRRIDVATAGVFALAVVSTAFTGQAIATGFDRRHGVLRFLGASPLGREGLLIGKLAAVGFVIVVQLVVLGTIAAILGWHPAIAGLLPALVTVVLGATAFLALGLLLAGTVRAEGVLALANLAWVLLLGLGVLLPTERLPDAVAGLARALPSGALGDGLRLALVDGQWPLGQWLVLAVWAAAAGAATARWFRWSD